MRKKFVPRLKFEEMGKKISCMTISEKGRSEGSVRFENKLYVITGAIGTGTGVGWKCVWGNRIVPLESYSGSLKALSYTEHNDEVHAKRRERGYDGMLITDGGKKVVMTGPSVEFYPVETEIQLSIFGIGESKSRQNVK